MLRFQRVFHGKKKDFHENKNFHVFMNEHVLAGRTGKIPPPHQKQQQQQIFKRKVKIG